MARIGEGLLRFDIGISTVRRADDPQRLPDEGAAPALDTRPIPMLDALYDAPDANERALAAAEPAIEDRTVLDPGNYAAALRDGRDALAALADTAPPAERVAFIDALAVLDAAEDVRLVLDTAMRLLMRA